MGSIYKIYQQHGIYFVTSTIIEFIPVFVDERMFKILIDAFHYCQKEMELKVYSYVILDNHFHAILSAGNLTRVMKSLKMFSASKIIQTAKEHNKIWLINQFSYWKKKNKRTSKYQVWQEGFHPKEITSQIMMRQKIEYIHNNPVRRGLVEMPEHWKYSSAKNYLGMESALETEKYW